MKFFVCLFILTSCVFAAPKTLDFIFVAPTKTSTNYKIFEKYFKKYMPVAQNNKKCIPMGDGCFDPQKGFIPGESGKDIIEEEQKKNVKVKTINSMDTNMIDCKKDYYFDIFCGKSKNEKKGPVDYEVWVDTSSSLRRVDYTDEKGYCSRRSFVERLQKHCKLEVAVFDTSIKQLGGLDSLCVTYGNNDQDRFMRWIEESNAKHLIVITDIDESSVKLRDFLFKVGANIHGAEWGDIDGRKLVAFSEKLSKSCQKKGK